jgi:hypothetical protein
MKTRWKLVVLFAALWGVGALEAQVWQPITNIFEPFKFVTTGGVTYAEFRFSISGCEDLKGYGPLARDGGDFSFDFDLAMETGVACREYVALESATVVLGELAPGAYTLTTTSWGVPVGSTNFVVPTNSTPMIQPIGFAADGSFQIQLNGVANVGYVLQSSTNFTSWTSLSTNFVGRQIVDKSPPATEFRFYRAQILETAGFGPGPL